MMPLYTVPGPGGEDRRVPAEDLDGHDVAAMSPAERERALDALACELAWDDGEPVLALAEGRCETCRGARWAYGEPCDDCGGTGRARAPH